MGGHGPYPVSQALWDPAVLPEVDQNFSIAELPQQLLVSETPAGMHGRPLTKWNADVAQGLTILLKQRTAPYLHLPRNPFTQCQTDSWGAVQPDAPPSTGCSSAEDQPRKVPVSMASAKFDSHWN